MLTVLEVIKKTADFFAAKGIESPRLNAELLIGHALGLRRMQLYLQFERVLQTEELDRLRPLVLRRGKREPLQYVTGETEFFGLKLKTDRRALIPRPETEYLVQLLVGRTTPAPMRVLDLGTGSGAIALALAKAWPTAMITAVDRSAEALALAIENAAATGLSDRITWLLGDWFAPLPPDARFELIVSNPPYLSAREVQETAPEVRSYEPIVALEADDSGLAALKTILELAPGHLGPEGELALETGIEHHAILAELAEQRHWVQFRSLQDLAGRNRYITIQAPSGD